MCEVDSSLIFTFDNNSLLMLEQLFVSSSLEGFFVKRVHYIRRGCIFTIQEATIELIDIKLLKMVVKIVDQ